MRGNLCLLISSLDVEGLLIWLYLPNLQAFEHILTCRQCSEKVNPILERHHETICDHLTRMTADDLLGRFSKSNLPLLYTLHLPLCTDCSLRFLEPLQGQSELLPEDVAGLLYRARARVMSALSDEGKYLM